MKIKLSQEKCNSLKAIGSIAVGTATGLASYIFFLYFNIAIFGWNLGLIFAPLIAGYVETELANEYIGESIGAVSAFILFIVTVVYGFIISNPTLGVNIITVGSLTKSIKRPDIILKAFNTIKNTFSNWTVEIVGGTHDLKQEEYKAELEKYIKNNNLDDMVFLSGRTLNITEKLLSAEIFAFPSKSEAFGLALAEAMSSGLPAIGYKSCPSVNELIIDGYNGFLCDDGIDAFAEKMKILMQNKELRKQMGQNAKESIKQFAPEKIWNQWEDLMKKVIKIKKY